MFGSQIYSGDVMLSIYQNNRTIFRLSDIAMLAGETIFKSLNKKLNYYVRDFNLINTEKLESVYNKVQTILLKYGTISDEAKKYHGPIIVLDYGVDERKLKVEISVRQFDNHYEIKNLLGINMKVLVQPDMFAHKLCALPDRNTVTNRDIFDCWFFMQKQTPVNKSIVESRMEMPYSNYIQKCIETLESMTDKGLLQGLGELMDNDLKNFVRTKLRTETIGLLKFYRSLQYYPNGLISKRVNRHDLKIHPLTCNISFFTP